MKKLLARDIQDVPVFVYFFLIFICSFFGQSLIIKDSIVDHTMWREQSRYVEEHRPEQFDASMAYGHPGGPVILGTIAIKHIFHIQWENALTYFLVLIDSILITLISYTCYLLLPKSDWWRWIPFALVFHHSYSFNTPPSVLTTLLVPLQCFYTLYLYKKDKITQSDMTYWSLLAGFSIATRADIGGLMSLLFGIFLFRKQKFEEIISILGTSFLVFFLLDPFMYFMPITHMQDIISKMLYHYSDYNYTKYTLADFFVISTPSLICFMITLILLWKKKITETIPKAFLYLVIVSSVLIHILFLTSHYKAYRYFAPILSIWEILLFLYIILITEQLPIEKKHKTVFKIVFCGIIVLSCISLVQ